MQTSTGPEPAQPYARGAVSSEAQFGKARGRDRPAGPRPLPARPRRAAGPSLMPAAARASAEMRPCVVEAGCVSVVLVSPRLAVIDSSSQESTTRHASLRAPLTSNETMAPPFLCCRIASACCGCDGSPNGRRVQPWVRLQPLRQLQRLRRLRLHADLQRFQPFQQYPGVESR